MKNLILFSSILFSISSFAAESMEWGNLEQYERYQLGMDVEIPGVATFKTGEKFDLNDIISGGVPIVYFQLHAVDCQNPDLVSDMILINPSPEDTDRDHSVGIQLEEGCNLGVYVETQDVYSKSLFLDLSTHQAL